MYSMYMYFDVAVLAYAKNVTNCHLRRKIEFSDTIPNTIKIRSYNRNVVLKNYLLMCKNHASFAFENNLS